MRSPSLLALKEYGAEFAVASGLKSRRRRLHASLIIWTLIVAGNASKLVYDAFNGFGRGTLVYLLVVLLGFYSVGRRVVPLLRPRRHRLDPARVRALSQRKLDLLEIALDLHASAAWTERTPEGFVSEEQLLQHLLEEHREFLPPEQIGGPRYESTGSSLAALVAAGLLEDRRRQRGDELLLFSPAAEAREALADERGQRLQLATLGPRVRPSMLSEL